MLLWNRFSSSLVSPRGNSTIMVYLHSANAAFPIVVNLLFGPKAILRTLPKEANAPGPMVLTLAGMMYCLKLSTPAQAWNALVPMVVIPSQRVSVFRSLHPLKASVSIVAADKLTPISFAFWNARIPILVTVLGILTLRAGLLRKAQAPMLVIPFSILMEVTLVSTSAVSQGRSCSSKPKIPFSGSSSSHVAKSGIGPEPEKVKTPLLVNAQWTLPISPSFTVVSVTPPV